MINSENNSGINTLSPTAKKMPEEFQYVLTRLNNNINLFNTLKALLQQDLSRMVQIGMGHQTYCNFLRVPNEQNFVTKLLKVYGLTEKQLLKAFGELGYDKNINKMYVVEIYQVLSLTYWIGLEKDDRDLRFFAISFMAARLFNGRLKRFYPNGPNGCNEEIANYVLNNVLNNNSVFKKYRSPVMLILQYFAPTMDQKYAEEIKTDPANKTRGLKILMNQLHARIFQAFKVTSRHYYQAYQDGNKESLQSNIHTFSDNNKVEKYEGFDSNIGKLADTIVKGLMFKKKPLNDKNIEILKTKFGISDKVTKSIMDFIHNDEDDEIIKEYYEYLLRALKLSDVEKICSLHIMYITNEIVGAKGRDVNIVQLKDKTDILIKNIFNKIQFTSRHATQLIKLRKVLISLTILKMKEQLCTKQKDFLLE